MPDARAITSLVKGMHWQLRRRRISFRPTVNARPMGEVASCHLPDRLVWLRLSRTWLYFRVPSLEENNCRWCVCVCVGSSSSSHGPTSEVIASRDYPYDSERATFVPRKCGNSFKTQEGVLSSFFSNFRFFQHFTPTKSRIPPPPAFLR